MRTAVIAALAAVLWLVGCGDDSGTGDDTETGDPIVVPDDLDGITRNTRPTKRSEIRTAAHPATNSILIFGGNDGPVVNQFPSSRFQNDTWIFEPGSGWVEVQSEETPRRRARYAIAVDHAGNRALMFGGRFRQEGASGDYTLFNDLWQFDFVTREWTQLDNGRGAGKPAPRYYGQGAWDASTGTFYVWGGNLNTSALIFEVTDELWTWTEADGWSEQNTSGRAPSARSFLGSTHDTARNELVIFGGQVGDLATLAYNDTYALNLDSFSWRRLHNGERGQAPSTRMHAPMIYDDQRDRYVLFGGHTDVGDQNDLWQFDPEAGNWRELLFADELHPEVGFGCANLDSEVPAEYVTVDVTAPERRHNGMVAHMYDSIWVFGGWHAECSDHLDDTWRFDLAAESWSELLEAQSGESCERADEDCQCLCI